MFLSATRVEVGLVDAPVLLDVLLLAVTNEEVDELELDNCTGQSDQDLREESQ